MEKQFGYAIIDLMKERGLTQSEVSRRSGVPRSSLHRYVNGADMPASVAKALADAIGVTVDEFLGVSRGMPADEMELLDYYRACSVRGKANVPEYAEDAARRHPKSHEHLTGIQSA